MEKILLKKIAASLKVVLIALLVGGGTIVSGVMSMTSLEVSCDLQDDQSYSCQSRDTYLDWTFSEVNAEQVSSIEEDLTCGGAGKNKGCSAHAEFLTTTGDRVILSRRYTDPDQVRKAVNTLTPLLAGKSTPIEMTFPPSSLVSVIMISVGSCIFLLLIFVAFIMLFGKDVNDPESNVIDLRKKN
jgi:hypothetical protein